MKSLQDWMTDTGYYTLVLQWLRDSSEGKTTADLETWLSVNYPGIHAQYMREQAQQDGSH